MTLNVCLGSARKVSSKQTASRPASERRRTTLRHGGSPSRRTSIPNGRRMNASQQKVVQYLGEAQASEHALVRVLQSQIAMTPRGAYRTGARAAPAPRRATTPSASASACEELGQGGNPLHGRRSAPSRASSARCWRSARRRSTCCAAPAARRRSSRTPRTPAPPRRWRSPPTPRSSASPTAVGDDRDGQAGRVDPRRRGEDARSASCARSPSSPTPSSAPTSRATRSYDITTTGAGRRRPRRRRGRRPRPRARRRRAAKRTARQARKVPGVAQAEGQVKGAVASEGDLAIARYDSLTADEITGRLAELSQIDLAKVDAYERKTPEPHHDPRAASPRCAATSRGPATTS